MGLLDDVVKWGPIVVSVLSLLIAFLGHRLRQKEVVEDKEDRTLDSFAKINDELRAELKRCQENSIQLHEQMKVLTEENRRQRDELLEYFFNKKKAGQP